MTSFNTTNDNEDLIIKQFINVMVVRRYHLHTPTGLKYALKYYYLSIITMITTAVRYMVWI